VPYWIESTHYFSLAFSPTGQLYIAYADGSNYGAAVKRFNGTSWENAARRGTFSPTNNGIQDTD